jgi:membrane dipeptidase
LGDVYTNPPRYGGLTPFGASVIKECNRLGMLIDLAHANVQTTQMALKVTTKPVIVSHTGLDTQLGSDPRMAEMMRPRLISKDQARMIADAGGLVGVWTHLSNTPADYARNKRSLFIYSNRQDHVIRQPRETVLKNGKSSVISSGVLFHLSE